MLSSLAATPINLLLSSLSLQNRLEFLSNCEHVDLKLADIIYNAGDHIDYIYFPTDSIISLINPVDNNAGMGVALIGNEGMLGITIMLGSSLAPFSALVQASGSALRITAKAFLKEIEKRPELQLTLKRYICVSFSQVVQTTVCNRFHVVEERLARLLLMICDKKHAKQFYITQELLAQMLGVRRVGVTKAAGSLKYKKLINYSRGLIGIHDTTGLEAVSCACYKIDKDIYHRILNSQTTE